ncbi:putative glycerol-3-phosphate o-acyltransferase protein [Venturia nashicola]|uniref:Putative glycerol-3-phosphate o-acyltransferase protein n=1 Tax=Venturia nashicola TaxID=86259 RepID=A0A4Z1NMD3_9PEZI|nr:putative glycerol-3-phosphate o-acyltransferase protein [Venturia nashicola]TLD21732.1 putative glycerol-3-phosphate o-acyltransferase protein [Venturia nashicola]
MAPDRAGKKKKLAPMNNFVYDLFLWIFSIVVELFFREIHPRSSWKIPRKGPVIFVAAPHANQFVDPLILMRVVRNESHRRIAFLIAEKSMRRKAIGFFARLVGAVPVGRALDSTKQVSGRIYLPDPDNDPLLLRGVGTNFEGKDFQVGGLIVLPNVNHSSANAEILEIKGPEELRLKKPFKGITALGQLTGKPLVVPDGETEESVQKSWPNGEFSGTTFKVAPKVDQTVVYDAVFEKLHEGGCVGIFPEGGSHDRTELLPLKAGVAIMALGALSADPDCGLTIIPCGMNYFHAHKFRSRAVVEFGTPVDVPTELIELYKTGDRRAAVGKLLDDVYNALVSVTVTAPDYDTLMLIQAVRRLYNPKGKKLPLPMVVELNRRLVKGYEHYKDDARIIALKKSVLEYNRSLLELNIRDHQVDYAKLPVIKVILTLFYRLGKILLLAVAVLPGLFLFAPVFIAGKLISIKKSKEALAASTVKIEARDVMATWKLLVSLALAPTLYTVYTMLLTWWIHRNRMQGYAPDWIPLWLVVVAGYTVFPFITYGALRFGETGMDIVKSLRPLFVALSPWHGSMLFKLRERRAALAARVTDVINTLGPEMFPDFDSARIVADPFQSPTTPGSLRKNSRQDSYNSIGSVPTTPTSPTHISFTSPTPGDQATFAAANGKHQISRNESFNNFSHIGLFASRPSTPHHARSRSRTNSSAFPVTAFSSLDGKDSLEEVSKRIRGAMKERGQRRRSETEMARMHRDGFDGTESGYTTGSEEDGGGLRMTSSAGKKGN